MMPFCIQCGAKLSEEAFYCRDCGRSIDDAPRLREQLRKSRRNTKVLGVFCIVAVAILLVGSFSVILSLSLGLELAELNRFRFYYESMSRQRFGVDDLESYLDRWRWVEGAYAADTFDCSEMSAYVERRLEIEGYHTMIVVGRCPWDKETYHAWLLVETSEGKHMPVEATHYELVKWDDPYFDMYFEYDHLFESIHDALDYDAEEFVWWDN